MAPTTKVARGACTVMAAALLFAVACGSSDKEPDVQARGGRTARGGASAVGGTPAQGGNTATDPERGGSVSSGGTSAGASGGSTAVETHLGGSTAGGSSGGTAGGTPEGGSGGASITTQAGSTSGGTSGASSVAVGGSGGTGGTGVCIAPSKPAGTGEVLSFDVARDYATMANYVGLPFDLGDLDHDGYLDVVMALTNNGRIAVLRGTSDGAFGTATEITISGVNNAWLEDFDADGDLGSARIPE
ncbi:MAG: VCBS repeat-containing protein [Polyangiaceae bacterium]